MEKAIVKYLLPFFIFSALCLLAFFNDWNYDETCTYLFVKETSIGQLLTYQNFTLANHHLLNSLFFKLIQCTGLKHVIFYRLLSLLSFIIFWYSNKRILNLLGIPIRNIILLIVAPYFIYFTLGRGYGFSLALCSMSLLYLIKFKENKSGKNETLFLLTGVLSVLSIFSFLYVFMGMLTIFIYLKRRETISFNSIIKLIVVLIFLLYVYYAGKIINVSDPNIIGSNSFFNHGTISSFFSEFSYHNYQSILNKDVYYNFLKKIVLFCLLSPLMILFFRNQRIAFLKNGRPFLFIMTLTMMFMLISNIFFLAKFPIGRAIIYLQYLYLFLLLIFLKNIGKKYATIPIIVLLTLSVYMNSTHYFELLKPSVKNVLIQTKQYPLYISNTNPNIRLLNNFEHLKNNDSIFQSKSIHQLVKWAQKDPQSIVYILCKENELNYVNLNFTSVKNYRGGLTLLLINK